MFCYFKVLLSLKVVKFDTKMYLNFSNFQGTRLGWGGGQALVQKQGRVLDGGIAKFFAGWGDPQSPQEKTLIPTQKVFEYPPGPQLTASIHQRTEFELQSTLNVWSIFALSFFLPFFLSFFSSVSITCNWILPTLTWCS